MSLAEINYNLSHGQTECLCLSQNDLEDQGQWPPVSISAEFTRMQVWWFHSKSVTSDHAHKPNFLEVWDKNSQNDLEGQSRRPSFPIPSESIPWSMFGSNTWRHHMDKQKFTADRRAKGRRDRRMQWRYRCGMKGQRVKRYWSKPFSHRLVFRFLRLLVFSYRSLQYLSHV